MSSEYRNLPDGYVQVEYIRHNYVGVIDTGINNSAGTTMSADFQFEEAKPGFYHAVFGCNTDTSKLMCQINLGNNFDVTKADFSQSFDVLTRCQATASAQTGYTASSKIYIFGYGGGNCTHHIIRLYSATITQNGTLVRDFVPCYRVSDSQTGLYDMITGIFFWENNGVSSSFRRVEYFKSDGNQYIDFTFGVVKHTTGFIIRFKTWSKFNDVSGEYGTIIGEQKGASDLTGAMYLTTYSEGDNLYGEFKRGTQDPISANLKAEEIITVSCSTVYNGDQAIYCDPNGNIIELESDDFSSVRTIRVFLNNGSGETTGSVTALYNLVFFTGDKCTYDYVPCINTSNQTLFLLDTLHEVTGANIGGTGTMTHGDIIDNIFYERGYLSPAGTEIFNTTQLTVEFGLIKDYPETTIQYEGDDDSGVTVVIESLGTASGVRVNRTTGGEYLSIDPTKLQKITGASNGDIIEYDHIEINTRKGKKSANLWRNGVKYNILNAVVSSPKWIFLERGNNKFTFSATYGTSNLRIYLSYTERLNGV